VRWWRAKVQVVAAAGAARAPAPAQASARRGAFYVKTPKILPLFTGDIRRSFADEILRSSRKAV